MTLPLHALNIHAQLSTSPRLMQAVRLLQMSSLEYEQELAQQLALNPFLEDPRSDDLEHDDAETGTDDDAEPALFDHALLDAGAAEATPAEATVVDGDTDGERFPEASFETPGEAGTGDRSVEAWDFLDAPRGLREHLHEQLDGARLAPRARLAAMLVIETLDDDGYLRNAVAETAEALQLAEPPSDAELAAGLHIVQQFDPAGVAARDLAECLALQLQTLPPGVSHRALALRLATTEHLALLAHHDHRALQSLLDCSLQALGEAQALLRRLDPRPGRRHDGTPIACIIPDVIVRLQRGQLVVVTNPALLSRAQINQGCASLLQRCGGSEHPALRQQLQEARWLLRNVAQRHQTIQRVAEAIIEAQRAFFQYGEVALRPLILREIAERLELHESTLSRATANKYMATPRGLFEFRHFFSRQLGTDTGGHCSASAVRALIREMIDGESRAAPLSDVVLAHRLVGQGIRVARRTVTKYRNQMKLPPGELRYQS